MKAHLTVTHCALSVVMGIADEISSDHWDGYKSDMKSIDPHTSQCTPTSLQGGSINICFLTLFNESRLFLQTYTVTLRARQQLSALFL